MICGTSHREDWRTGSIPRLPLLRKQKFKTQKGASMAVEKELIALRADEKISRKEMAELIGTTPETYRKKELGESDWWGAELFLIASKFNKRIDDIFLDKKVHKKWFRKSKLERRNMNELQNFTNGLFNIEVIEL